MSGSTASKPPDNPQALVDILPSTGGTYLLTLECPRSTEIRIGALGTRAVAPGIYLYAGSAFGPGGLKGRLGRHIRGGRRHHWHIDYLRCVCTFRRVWYAETAENRECVWAAAAARLRGSTAPFSGFGASDCRCDTHLVRCKTLPSLQAFRRHLRGGMPSWEKIRQLVS